MFKHTLRPVTVVLALTASLALSACGATDSVNDIKEASDIAKTGLGTAQYFKEIQPQLQAYSQAVSSLKLVPPHDAKQAAALRASSKQLSSIAKDLEAVTADSTYKDAHAKLIASVEKSAEVANTLADAADAGDDAEFNRLMSDEWAPAQSGFAEAMKAATQPVVDAAGATNK